MTRSWWLPLLMLAASNVFMTYAWYGHLKRTDAPVWIAILSSWAVAFLEYCLMVPANRWGSHTYTPYQLKVAQEVISLGVFAGFAFFYFGTRPQWNHLAAFVCILAAVVFIMLPGRPQ